MADDVQFTVAANATPPGGTLAATDETTAGPHSVGSHMGVAKLAVSADGDSTHIPATATDGLLVDVSNVTPGTGATDLGKTESTAHASGDVGVEALAVRNDTSTPMGPDGTYVPLQVQVDALKTASRTMILDGAGLVTSVGIGAGGVPMPVSDDGGSLTVDILGPTTATRTAVADNAADVQLLAANANREKYSVTNDSTAVLYLADGVAAASLTSYTVQIPPNGFYSNSGYTGEVRGIWATDPGTGAARITEYT